jgi:HAD superfamily hydrolase (TIGR01509 family)
MQRFHSALGATKAVVFDLGGVLIDLHSEAAGRELVDKYGMRTDRFAQLTRSCFTSRERSITELAMVGEVATAQYLEAFLRECTTKDMEAITANRLSVIGRERADVFAVAKQLREAGLMCCVFSNTIALHWEKLSSRSDYPSLCGFDRIFASHLIAHAKPEANAFSFVADALNLRLSECLLIDDTPLNVDRAWSAGWRGLLFRDAASLQHQLITEGLYNNEA